MIDARDLSSALSVAINLLRDLRPGFGTETAATLLPVAVLSGSIVISTAIGGAALLIADALAGPSVPRPAVDRSDLERIALGASVAAIDLNTNEAALLARGYLDVARENERLRGDLQALTTDLETATSPPRRRR